MVAVVLGASGQVGQALQKVASRFPEINFIFLNRLQADVTDADQINSVLAASNAGYCINLAAYTAVDKAELEQDMAWEINVRGAENVAQACKAAGIRLIHISTDFVFDGVHQTPYTESDTPNPINVYGRTKHEGEVRIAAVFNDYYIIRASWIYSEFGSNFYKTMLRLAGEGKTIRVVNDQTGAPTHARDLAEAICILLRNPSAQFGIYHFSNKGETTWFDFARKIFENMQLNVEVIPVSSVEFGALARRPAYSVLNTSKIQKELNIPIRSWIDALKS